MNEYAREYEVYTLLRQAQERLPALNLMRRDDERRHKRVRELSRLIAECIGHFEVVDVPLYRLKED